MAKKIKKPVYTVDYFIEKFRKIPAARWCEDELFIPETNQRCALGHCGVRETPSGTGGVWTYTREGNALSELFDYEVTAVNDSELNDICYFPSSVMLPCSPRGRILAALRYIKKKQTK